MSVPAFYLETIIRQDTAPLEPYVTPLYFYICISIISDS